MPDYALSNQNNWEQKWNVEYYSGLDYLFSPEKKLLDEIKIRPGFSRMLDIGVGGGRTTRHFAQAVADYQAGDYSKQMVESCIRRFGAEFKNARFDFLDARDLKQYETGMFDVVLFSFNGIDSVSHDDRLKAFREIRRVVKTGGIFLFSTHNILAIPDLYPFYFSLHPWRLFRSLYNFMMFRWINRAVLGCRSDNHLTLVDSRRFTIANYYVQPQEQLRQLESCGFNGVQIMDMHGNTCPADDPAMLKKNAWLHYWCQA